MKKPFVIAHLSDLHLTETDHRQRSEARLLGQLKGMNAAFRKIARSPVVRDCDLLLLTGDITDDGSLKTWQIFWDIIRRNHLLQRCLVLPGNHDVCCLGSRIFTGARDRYQTDLRKMRAGLLLGDASQKVRFPWARPVDPVHNRVVIFGLDSCNKGNLTAITNAMGRIGYRQLEKLARLFKKYREVPTKIVALHHSPNIPGPQTARKRNLEEMSDLERWGMEVPEFDRRALRLLCITNDVKLVVHGHLHRQENRYVNGLRFIGSPASTKPLPETQPKQYGLWTYTISPTGKRLTPKFAKA